MRVERVEREALAVQSGLIAAGAEAFDYADRSRAAFDAWLFDTGTAAAVTPMEKFRQRIGVA